MSDFAEEYARIRDCVATAQDIYKNVDEKDVLMKIGAASIRLGLVPSGKDATTRILVPKQNRSKFVSGDLGREDLDPIPPKQAQQTGTDVWDQINSKLKPFICTPELKKLIDTPAALTSQLVNIATAILVAIGTSSLVIPLVAELLVAILVMLLKAGIYTYCGWTPPATAPATVGG